MIQIRAGDFFVVLPLSSIVGEQLGVALPLGFYE